MIAEQYLIEKYPDFNKVNKKIVMKSVDNNWQVTYELPENMLGGAPVVIIENETGRIINTYRTQ